MASQMMKRFSQSLSASTSSNATPTTRKIALRTPVRASLFRAREAQAPREERMNQSSLRRSAAFLCAGFLTSAAMCGAAWAQAAAPAAPGAPAAAAAAPAQPAIPRDKDGHPDFGGLWAGGVGPVATSQEAAQGPNFAGRNNSWASFEEDNALRRLVDTNLPVYLPKWWEKIKDNDYDGNWLDPRQQCMPEGLPRIGAPAYILNVPDQKMIAFRYNTGFDGRTEARFIPTDGRPHNPNLSLAETWYGDSVGHWEGD